MTDRIPGAPGRCKAMVTGEDLQRMQSGEEFAITLRRDDAPIREGTPYNKANVLPDELASALCPEVEDPAPKDAFAALQAGKADTGRRKSGSSITLNDAVNAPLMGLRIFGHDRMDDNGEVHIVGEKGSVTVKVMGKNLITLDGFEYMTKQEDGSYKSNAQISAEYLVPLFLPEGIYCVSGYIKSPVDKNYRFKIKYTDGTKQESFVKSNGDWQFCVFATNGKAVSAFYFDYSARSDQVYVKDLQIEVGSTATAFEPYKEPQSITVPTPGGMFGGDDLYDEIDFGKGVLIRRISEQSETPLPEDVLENYAQLRTYAPTTIITNDDEANMEVCYCTPSTAVLVSQDQQGQWLHEELEGDPGQGIYKKLGSGILAAHGNFRCGVIGMLPEISEPGDYRLQSAIRFPDRFSMPPVITVLMSDPGEFGLTDFKVTKVERDFVEFEMKSKMGRDVYAEISVSAIGTWK